MSAMPSVITHVRLLGEAGYEYRIVEGDLPVLIIKDFDGGVSSESVVETRPLEVIDRLIADGVDTYDTPILFRNKAGHYVQLCIIRMDVGQPIGSRHSITHRIGVSFIPLVAGRNVGEEAEALSIITG